MGTADDFSKALAKLNSELKAGNTKVKVERRGDRLSLVAYLPNKQGIDKRSRRISPGLNANLLGLKEIKRLALKLAGDLVGDRFDWNDWIDESDIKSTSEKTCSEWVEGYKIHLACSGSLKGTNEAKDRQWRRDYWNAALKWLPLESPLNDQAVIIAALHHDAVDSNGKPRRSRQLACIRLSQFAKWAGLTVDLKSYRGKYTPNQVDRNIPTDEDILENVLNLINPDWKWVAGMMATFGLRDHECWYTSISQDKSGWLATVTEGKTGSRTCRALHPQWVDKFNLANGKPPNIIVRGHSEYGERCSRHFKRSRVGFCPYDLRHAYAIRGSLVYKIPVAVMAAFMGHSPTVFLKIYSKHLSAVVKDEAYTNAIKDIASLGNSQREIDI